MCGSEARSGSLFSYVETRVPRSQRCGRSAGSWTRRWLLSIPPEQLLRALLLLEGEIAAKLFTAVRRRSAIDGRTRRHGDYPISQKKRKRIEGSSAAEGRRRSAPDPLPRPCPGVRMAFIFARCLQPNRLPKLTATAA